MSSTAARTVSIDTAWNPPLEFQAARLRSARRADAEEAFRLNAADCAELFEEGILYCHRIAHFLRLEAWVLTERDTARNLRLLDLVRRYAACEEDRGQLEPWRFDLIRMHAVAHAMILQEQGGSENSQTIGSGIRGRVELRDNVKARRKLTDDLLQKLHGFVAAVRSPRRSEESVFAREGDYWTIMYQGEISRVKSTRGFANLACLLRHPGREFHVSDLVLRLIDSPVTIIGVQQGTRPREASPSHNAGPMLDSRAKSAYQHRLQELRMDFAEAQQFNDSQRAAGARSEMNAIAGQISLAVGLGGRDRRIGCEAERARSTVTKRIKHSVYKIRELMPALGGHLTARIKTGYFCVYNSDPNHPIAWQF